MRVTHPLSRWSPYKDINEVILANAAARGTAVHASCVSYAKDGFTLPLPEDQRGYFVSFKRWFDAHVLEVVDAEFEVRDDGLDLVGHPDFLLRTALWNLALIDLKTAVTYLRVWEAQLAAYFRLVSQFTAYGVPDFVGTLMLDPDGGEARMKELKNPGDHWWGYYHAYMAERYFNPQGGEE